MVSKKDFAIHVPGSLVNTSTSVLFTKITHGTNLSVYPPKFARAPSHCFVYSMSLLNPFLTLISRACHGVSNQGLTTTTTNINGPHYWPSARRNLRRSVDSPLSPPITFLSTPLRHFIDYLLPLSVFSAMFIYFSTCFWIDLPVPSLNKIKYIPICWYP